ncbi:protein of unknown function [Kyrpidia spormannii]|uniref:Uncharacterized protein n=1 Tax=Kyrpidia spormannii TaxID=2055160 RepID=A0ACA8ZAZ6_9BACL|nr:protein of unknown function [Kyrpidia spormannii]
MAAGRQRRGCLILRAGFGESGAGGQGDQGETPEKGRRSLAAAICADPRRRGGPGR